MLPTFLSAWLLLLMLPTLHHQQQLFASALGSPPPPAASPRANERLPIPTTLYMKQPLDHSNPLHSPTFDQRYLVHAHPHPRVVFFYAGNEAPVDKYVASCGLMWENRAAFRATLVFAEHRFWGESIPDPLDYRFIGPEHALQDYFALMLRVRTHLNATLPVVVFGGSYGGMLAAWARLLRPDLVQAAVASSAPVLAFVDPRLPLAAQTDRFYQDGGASYWRVASAGHFAPCAAGIHRALTGGLDAPGAFAELGACPASASRTPQELAAFAAYVLESLAMGDYPFSTDYIADGALPAWPAAKACGAFRAAGGGLAGLGRAMGVFLNASKSLACFDVPPLRDASYDGLWDRMWCQSLMPQETYFATRGMPHDMFRPMGLDWSEVEQHCRSTWGVFPRDKGAVFALFGAVSSEDWARRASNIVFANGALDPWSSGGFRASPSALLPVVWLRQGAHHADLFFSHPDDPAEFALARARIMLHVRHFLATPRSPLMTPLF